MNPRPPHILVRWKWLGGLIMYSIWGAVYAQPVLTPNNELFLQEEVATVRVTLDADSLAEMLADVQYGSTHEYPATFVYQSSVLNDTVTNVGFRIRGNTSINSGKKSFKVAFNSFTKGKQFLGVEKLNLNGEHNDPSLMRAKLSWELLRNIGLPGSRTSYVLLYINDEYRGVYLNVEHIDEEFTDKVFDDGSGNLYKCLYPADLNDLGSNPASYSNEVNGRRPYDLQGNRTVEDYTDLVELIQVINQTPLADLPCELEAIFNVDDYLKFVAFDVLIGNWDGHLYNKNNFYLYHNQRTNRFEYLAYDLDNTLGIDWIGRDWADRNPYTWDHESRPLYERLMDIPTYREQYTGYLKSFALDHFTGTWFRMRAAEIQILIGPHVQTDPFYPLDYGFTHTDFLEATEQAWGNPMVDYGVAEFVDERRDALSQQLDAVNPDLIVLTHFLGESPQDGALHYRVLVEGAPDRVELLYAINGAPFETTVPMSDNGQNGDQLAGDGIYELALPLAVTQNTFTYRFRAWKGSAFVTEPCTPLVQHLASSELPLVINELLAGNSIGLADEWNERDDWIEIYNAGADPIDLSNIYLTDDFDRPDRFQFPVMSLLPGDFVLVWADDDPEQGELHAPFKLERKGEEVALFERDGDDFRLLDRIGYEEQITNISYGRFVDADSLWINFTKPTPGATNRMDDPPIDDPGLIFWPNPNLTGVLFFSETLDLEVFDTQGRLVDSFETINSLEVTDWESGIYFLRHEEGVFKLVLP